MLNLKINNTSTPYWCVEVPVDAEIDSDMYFCGETLRFNYSCKLGSKASVYTGLKKADILGCITLEGMDEGVREIVNYCNDFTGLPVHQAFYEGAMSALLVHNQLTLTADKKAVVLKQIN